MLLRSFVLRHVAVRRPGFWIPIPWYLTSSEVTLEVLSMLEEFTFLETDFFRKKVVPALADQKIFLNMLYLREYIEFFHI